jgi:hypothetical protein
VKVTESRPGQLPRHMSTAALNRRAKLLDEAEAAGDRVIEAAQAWERTTHEHHTTEQVSALIDLSEAVRDLNARIAKVESAR